MNTNLKPNKSDKLSKAERVATAVEITSVRLYETNCLFKPGKGEFPEAKMSSQSEVTVDRENGRINVLPVFFFQAKDESNTDLPSIHIQARYRLRYDIPNISDFTDDELGCFGEINGKYNAWPFWREYVYSTLARMGLPPLTLPVFRYEEAVSDSEDDNTNE